jgi:hypothetical protein
MDARGILSQRLGQVVACKHVDPSWIHEFLKGVHPRDFIPSERLNPAHPSFRMDGPHVRLAMEKFGSHAS